MFHKILAWIKEVWSKMIGQSNVKEAMKIDVAISSEMATALTLWSQMYANNSPWLTSEIYSLNLPAAIAGEIARAATIEMVVKITGSARADYLAMQIERIVPKLREQFEKGCAKGGLMMKPYIDGKNISVDFVQADCFFPVSFDSSGNIVSCVFADQKTINNSYYTRLEYHRMTPAGCEVKNVAYKSSTSGTLGSEVPLSSVDAWANIQPEAMITGIDKPLFAYFRYPLANNIDPNSPLGVSCFSRAADGERCLIQQADEQWSDLLWEFESGRRALYVDALAFKKDAAGNPVLPNKRLYRTLGGSGNKSIGEMDADDLFHEWSPDYREENLLNGLDAILRKIEFLCGLAYGTLSNPATVDKTATELKMSNQRSFSTITDTQKAVKTALEQLIWAMDIWATLGKLAPAGSYETAFEFDDSIVVDKDTQFQQDARLVTQSIMSKVEFRMRNFGEDETTARKMLAMVTSEQPEPQSMFPAE